MVGNVSEWCYDEYSDHGTERPGDGRRPDPANGPRNRCKRGGSFGFVPFLALSGVRSGMDAPLRYDYLGARPARTSRR